MESFLTTLFFESPYITRVKVNSEVLMNIKILMKLWIRPRFESSIAVPVGKSLLVLRRELKAVGPLVTGVTC